VIEKELYGNGNGGKILLFPGEIEIPASEKISAG
jgi:hypothetical protein